MKTKTSINVTARVEIPQLPNFFRAGELTIPVEAIDEAGLRAIGKAWTEALVNHAKRRANPHEDGEDGK